MKTKLIFSFLMLTFGLMATAQNITNEDHPAMIEDLSRYGFTETVDTLSKNILANGWKILVTHDLQEAMKKNGKVVLPVKVIELCNPGLAFQVLSRDELRFATPMLPCRITVYEKSDGKTYIARMNAPGIAGMIGSDAAKTIVQAFKEAEEFVKAVTN